MQPPAQSWPLQQARSLECAARAEAASDATTVGKEVSNFEGDLKMATNPAEGIQEDVQGLENKVEAAAGPVQSFLQKVQRPCATLCSACGGLAARAACRLVAALCWCSLAYSEGVQGGRM